MKRINWFLIAMAIIVFLFLVLIYWLNPSKVGAKKGDDPKPPPPSCMQENAECKINDSKKECCEGLSCNKWKEDKKDGWKYKCEVLEDGDDECKVDCGGGDDTLPPEVVVFSPLSEAGAPSCDSVAPAKVPNIFVTNAGVGKLEVRWIPTGGDKAHIFYGEVAGKPAYSLIDTANDGSEVIGGLVSGQHYYFSVTNGGGCAWSSLSDWYDPIVE